MALNVFAAPFTGYIIYSIAVYLPGDVSFLELATSDQQFATRNSSSAGTNCREGMEPSLEESWSSLSFFDKRHKGRLTEKVQGEC